MLKSDLQIILDADLKKYNRLISVINHCNTEFTKKYFPFLGSEEPLTSISLYSFYPLLFDTILEIPKNTIDLLTKISHFHFFTLFLLDKIYDKQQIQDAFSLLALMDMHYESKSQINQFVQDNEKRTLIKHFYQETKHGLYKEKYNYDKHTQMSLSEIESYCFSKYSYAKIAILLYAEVSKKDNRDTLQKLLVSHDYFAVGRQILDDLDDFDEDYQNNSFNIYRSFFMAHYGAERRQVASKELKYDLLELAKEYFKKALVETQKYSNTGWNRYILFYLKEAEKLIVLLK
ncbi:hypothetical protein ACYRFT_04230 [Listeria kieliensis]